jgi:hypothetical protein
MSSSSGRRFTLGGHGRLPVVGPGDERFALDVEVGQESVEPSKRFWSSRAGAGAQDPYHRRQRAGPRARLLEDFFNERTLLEQAVATRPARHRAMTSTTRESHL